MRNLTCIEYQEGSDNESKTRLYLGQVLTHQEVCQLIAQAPLQRRIAEGQVFIGDEHFLVTDIFVKEHEVIFKEDRYRRSLPSKLVDCFSPRGGLSVSRDLLTDKIFQDSLKYEIVAKQL